eukprot:366490-Chlamydomonas_euryale.AAC.30
MLGPFSRAQDLVLRSMGSLPTFPEAASPTGKDDHEAHSSPVAGTVPATQRRSEQQDADLQREQLEQQQQQQQQQPAAPRLSILDTLPGSLNCASSVHLVLRLLQVGTCLHCSAFGSACQHVPACTVSALISTTLLILAAATAGC